ncbi:hypothetical protein BDR26DRAFT_12271 [Obelidium mucronatum]|nr:hypothetical protein BDR26DRAFT_12271 [Obelidium mucronatum]
MGDFAANESELSHTPSGGDASEIPLPIYVLYNNTNQLQKLAVANIYYVSNSATEIHIPAKNCTIRLYNLSNTLESTPDSLIQSLIEMFTFSSIPTSMSREIKILVTDGRASQMVSRLGTCLDVDVLLSMNVPATDLELINQTHLQIKRKYSSNRILFNRLLEPFESLLQSDYLTVEIKDMDIRVVKIESTLDRMVHSIINLGQKKLRTRQQVCTETVPLKGEEHGTRTLRTFRNPWDSDASTPNSSSPGDSFGRASAPIQGGTPAFDAADSTFWRGELDISSDMTDASEIETIGTCTVLVGNFPDETTEEELMSRFRHINILRCKIVNNKKADRRPFAFVDVKEMDRDLVLRMNGERFHGAKLKVEYDPSRLEKLGRKRADSVKLEMSHAVIEPSLPYSLKKSSSMNALEIYTAPVNPAPHSSTQFLPRPYTQSGVPGSQLFDSSNPLKKSDSWITHTGCSATNSQDAGVWQVQQHPLGSCQSQWLSGTKSSQESPTLKPKSLALKVLGTLLRERRTPLQQEPHGIALWA